MSFMSLTRPSGEQIAQVTATQAHAALTYEHVGATRGELPVGWTTDERQTVLGTGRDTFDRAVLAMRRWTQFELGWVSPVRADVPIQTGELFTFLARTVGVWTINTCRVVYVIDEDDGVVARFGFGYGTLGTHSVRGEERFLVEWDRPTDQVTFGIRKFSRPATALLVVLGPLTRWVQSRFTVDALARMADVVRN